CLALFPLQQAKSCARTNQEKLSNYSVHIPARFFGALTNIRGSIFTKADCRISTKCGSSDSVCAALTFSTTASLLHDICEVWSSPSLIALSQSPGPGHSSKSFAFNA